MGSRNRRRSGELVLTVRFVELGPETCLAVTSLGGFTIRGERSADPFSAVRSLFKGLAGSPEISSHLDSAIALDLALAGTTIADVAAETAAVTPAVLTAGKK